MEIILFNKAVMCIIAIALNLYAVELNDTLSLEAIIAIFDLYLILSLALVYFYFAEQITSDLLDIGDMFYNSPWYHLPIRQQKLLTLPIQRAARELRFKCLNIFDCSLAVFAAVNYNLFTFFSRFFPK